MIFVPFAIATVAVSGILLIAYHDYRHANRPSV